eukprot:1982073-Rhodomonas_salina.2
MPLAIGFMAITFCFSGFLIAEKNIPDYFIWIYWITPYSWVRPDPPPSRSAPRSVFVRHLCLLRVLLAPRRVCATKTDGRERVQLIRLLACNEFMSSGNDGEYDRMVLAPPTCARHRPGPMLQELGERTLNLMAGMCEVRESSASA